MLALQNIMTYYPSYLHSFKRSLLREYLQYKILEIVFDSDYGKKLCFMGGTCLRIIHHNQRFSEDLDFNHFGLSIPEFTQLSLVIEKKMTQLGYQIEMRNVFKGAYHCYVKFPNLLFQQGLSGYQTEKILIQLDTEAQHFDFTPQQLLLNKFDVFTNISSTPLPLLLAQKYYAILNRKRSKGRDFFDVVFLLGKSIAPNYAFLAQKVGIQNKQDLKIAILKKCSQLNFPQLAQDVEPFLFQAKDVKKVLLFPDYFKTI